MRHSDRDRLDTTAWKAGIVVDAYGPLLVGLAVALILIIMAWFATGEPY